MANKVRIAAYMRLSKADGAVSKGEGKLLKESNSILMQRILICQYITSHFEGYELTEYQDDGFSGIDFHRPGIQRLLEDAKNEKFDCIIVKDFSRFGRDYLEVGSYLEQIFPFLGIRFISINDHYDSDYYRGRVLDFDINFKNLLYDLYSRDLSQKVKSSLQARKESGQYVSSSEPFGYEKSSDDRHMLVVSEDEAEVVRLIFALALWGMTSSQIAKKLNTDNVPAPIEYKIKKGKASRKPKGDKFYWSSSTICNILRNPVYVGDVEYGKTERKQAGGRNILKAKDEWKIIKNHHAPIIARKDFEKLQENRGMGGKKRKRKENRHPLAGKAVCGCCKRKMRLKEGKNPSFTCYNRYVTGQDGCVSKADAELLLQTVLSCLEKYLKEKKLIAELADGYKADLKEKRADLLREIKQEERAYARLKQKHCESYQRYSFGEQSEFYSFRAQIEEKKELIKKLQTQIHKIDKQLGRIEPDIFALGEDVGLASEMIGQYVKEVVIYEDDMKASEVLFFMP